MAFSGTMGAAAAMTPIGVLTAPGGTLTYAADGIRVLKTAVGTVTPILKPSLSNLRLIIGVDQGNNPLAALTAGLPDAADADTGSLVTAAPGANQHGIPANFGPGRGNWTQDDLERLRVYIQGQFYLAAAVTNAGGVAVSSRVLAAGDITILVRNSCEVALLGVAIDLEWRHSLTVE